jgi:predicted transcriptional regulator
MSTLTLTLPKTDAERLVKLAERDGVTVEEAAARAVRAQLDADAAARQEIEAGLAELDAGKGVSLEDYEREMDVFVNELRAARG